MKKLGKLSINPERVMKNEELVNLRGGDWNYTDPCSQGGDKYFCQCEGSTGQWYGCYLDQEYAYRAIQTNCTSCQGFCEPVS